jgi:hypothetical protein
MPSGNPGFQVRQDVGIETITIRERLLTKLARDELGSIPTLVFYSKKFSRFFTF